MALCQPYDDGINYLIESATSTSKIEHHYVTFDLELRLEFQAKSKLTSKSQSGQHVIFFTCLSFLEDLPDDCRSHSTLDDEPSPSLARKSATCGDRY